MEDPDDFEAEVTLLVEHLCFNSTIARDVALELEREPADAVLVDCMLFTTIDVALASDSPTATLLHTALPASDVSLARKQVASGSTVPATTVKTFPANSSKCAGVCRPLPLSRATCRRSN